MQIQCNQLTLLIHSLIIGSILLILTTITIAAEVGGTLKGQLTDINGGEINSAAILMKHNEKGITRTTQSNTQGEYVLRNLPVGTYTLIISKDLFNTSRQNNIQIIIGQPVLLTTVLQHGSTLEEVIVVGQQQSILDMAETTAGMTFDSQNLASMPVDNGFESMILMTPGAVENGADVDDFNGASSIGGASSAENGYYLNGINITQIQSGLGSFRMPWEAISQTNVQTTGIEAEFGGALGGIVNAVSKTGSNEFNFGIQARVDPKSTYDAPPSVWSKANVGKYHEGPNRAVNNERNEDKYTEYNLWASGPIIKDSIFFYALFNPNEEYYSRATNSKFYSTTRQSDRWFANLEWFINEQHSIGITGFNTEREKDTKNFMYNVANNNIGEFTGNSYKKDGGKYFGINYHGEITSDISLDLAWGRTEEEEMPKPANALPRVHDCRSGTCSIISTHSNSTLESQEFQRDQLRIDLHWDLNDHRISMGIDSTTIDVLVNNRQNGIAVGHIDNVDDSAATGWWRIGISGSDPSVVGGIGVRALDSGVPEGQAFVRRRVRNRSSDSEVKADAFYLQDSWQIHSEITLNLGVRYINFENTVSSGETYAKMNDNIAPRLAAIWDIGGQGEHKVFATFGTYYQPVAARMNITQGATSIEYFDYYAAPTDGSPDLLPDGSPTRGARITGVERFYNQRGVTDPGFIASTSLKAMYSNQFSLGYNTSISDTLNGGVRITYNKLMRSVEDTDYGPVLMAKLQQLGIENNTGQTYFLALANPGEEVNFAYDFDQDGTIDRITLTEDELQLEKPERKYVAVDFTLDGMISDQIHFNASYTWSHNWGNTEGLVKTTNGQADPGWTSDYDYGEVLDYGTGNLPNDRRHSIKFAGTYDITNQFTFGLVFRAASGRPKNIMSRHPLGVDRCSVGNPWQDCSSRDYINTFYDGNGNPAPRGSRGTLPWTKVLDLSLSYRNEELFKGLLLKATIYNVLGDDKAIDIDEVAGPDYGLTDVYQAPRFLSLTSRLEF